MPPTDLLWPSQPRTLIKHQVYRHYLQCWMGKLLQVFPRAAVVDAFAGPGVYSDGPDGSPVVVAKTFLEHGSLGRFAGHLDLLCLEKDPDRRDHLDGLLDRLPQHPRLNRRVLPAGDINACVDELDARAHATRKDTPTLWLLDPFDFKNLPFDLVERCMSRPRDEVLVTWFAEELHRFCSQSNIEGTMNRYFGGDIWKPAVGVRGESARKEALLAAYRTRLEQLPDVSTGVFSIASRNESARYTIVFATHSDAGMECWNPVTWKLDPGAGHHASEQRHLDQGDLFADTPVLGPLQQALSRRAGTSATFTELLGEARRLGFLEKHLRQALDELRADGLAVREQPLKARSAWPADSVVRFYSPD